MKKKKILYDANICMMQILCVRFYMRYIFGYYNKICSKKTNISDWVFINLLTSMLCVALQHKEVTSELL